MTVPDAPSHFSSTPPPELSWWWRLQDATGGEVSVSEDLADQRFPSQGDAESWVGEFWPELAEEGVRAVVLFEHDRQVYGPMSLEA